MSGCFSRTHVMHTSVLNSEMNFSFLEDNVYAKYEQSGEQFEQCLCAPFPKMYPQMATEYTC